MTDKLPGRGAVRVEEFCAATGLTHAEVGALVESGRVEGLVLESGRPFGIFDDALPTADELRAFGLSPDPSYDPDTLRSHVGAEDDEETGDGPPTWTMSW